MKLLDTNIIIYMMRYHPDYLIERFMNERKNGLSISAVTYAELREGIEKSKRRTNNEKMLDEILKNIVILPFDDKAALAYGKVSLALYRSGFTVGKLDMQIASCAIANDITLVTNNTKDFRNIPYLDIEDWLIR